LEVCSSATRLSLRTTRMDARLLFHKLELETTTTTYQKGEKEEHIW
jgi:hypothetical protein